MSFSCRPTFIDRSWNHLHPLVSQTLRSTLYATSSSKKKKQVETFKEKGFAKRSTSSSSTSPSQGSLPDIDSNQESKSSVAKSQKSPNTSASNTGYLVSVEDENGKKESGRFSSSSSSSSSSSTSTTIVEERAKDLLRQKYGLRTMEEKLGSLKEMERIEKVNEKLKKVKNMSDEEFDIFQVLPPSLIQAIRTFLTLGTGLCTVFFVLAGIGITIEAWSVSTSHVLPPSIDDFIVQVIEPNFTIGFLVLLGFSVSLGLFATAQLGSGAAVYKEKADK